MKKGIFIILVVVFIAAVGGLIYFYSPLGQYGLKAPQLVVEDILPAGAVSFIRFSDIEQRVDEFVETKLWQNIKEIDFELLLKKSGLPDAQIEQFANIREEIFQTTTNLFLRKFFGQEVAIALYPVEFDPNNLEEVGKEAASSVFFVTRLKPEAQFMEFVSNIFSKFNQQVTTETKEYKDHKITLIITSIPDLKIGYTKIKDFIVFGIEEKVARSCIDVVQKESPSLSEDNTYVTAKADFLDSAQTVAYGDFEFFVSTIQDRLLDVMKSQDQEGNLDRVRDAFAQLKGFQTMSFSSVSGEVSKQKNVITFNRDELHPRIKKFYLCAPRNNKTLSFIPNNIIGYQWGSCFSLKKYWEDIKEDLSKLESKEETVSLQQAIEGVEQFLNLSLEEEILPAFGDEMGGFLADIDMDGVFPLPKFAFFVKVKDKSAAQKVVDALGQQPYFLFQSEEYESIPIKYVALPLGVDLQPGYCFIENYLLIASSRQLLKQSIDALGNEYVSLSGKAEFEEYGLIDRNHSVFYLRMDELVRKVKGLLEWGNNWWVMQLERSKAFQEGSRKNLEDKRKAIQREEAELERLADELRSLNEVPQEEQNTDVLSSSDLEQEIAQKEQEIALLKEQEVELEEIVQNYANPTVDSEVPQFYLDELIFPVLEGFESFKGIASRMRIGESKVETETFIEMEE